MPVRPTVPNNDVQRALARLDRVEQKRDRTVARAKADSVVSRAERKEIANLNGRVELAGKNVEVRKAERELKRTTRDAFEDGKAGPRERAELEKLDAAVTTLRAERRALRLQYPANPGDPSGGPTDFVLSSFNVTGSSHTGPGSDHPELETGVKRMRYVAKLLGEHKVDVCGFQELQPDQVRELQDLTDGKYAVYPGLKPGAGGPVNSIAWKKDSWSLVKADSVPIPYFDGHIEKMPVVLLRNKETGQQAYFANFHNPADTRYHHQQERFRDEATRREVALMNRLRKTGLPVFLTGDMNEHEEYRRHIRAGTDMHAAIDQAKGKPHVGIDWIFGSPDVKFSQYERDRDLLVRKTTDHPMIVTHAHIRA